MNKEDLKNSQFVVESRNCWKIMNSILCGLKTSEQHMPEYLNQKQIDLFRIQAHSIKGLMRQIDKPVLSALAEQMEMAARTEDICYIQENMEHFMLELKNTINQIKEEMQFIPKDTIPKDTNALADETNDSIVELWELLTKAFESYDISKIELQLERLKHMKLTEEEQLLVKELEAAGDDFDYELGKKLLTDKK